MTTEHVFPQALQAGDLAQATGGMTLRDYFAAKAMPLAIRQWHEEAQVEFHRRDSEQSGFVWLDEDSEYGSDCHIVATYAYAMADAMLRARQQPSE